jgi:hypothetical protein
VSGLGWAGLAVLLAAAALLMLRRRSEVRVDDPVTGDITRVPARQAPPAAGDDDAIDYAALEQAEREVRDYKADIGGGPSDDVTGDDWGPGTSKRE